MYDHECGNYWNYKCWKNHHHHHSHHRRRKKSAPCPEPLGITNVNPNGACHTHSSLPSGDTCQTSCADGKDPSVTMLTCNDGVFTPSTFTCATPASNTNIHHFMVFLMKSCSQLTNTLVSHSWNFDPSLTFEITAATTALVCNVAIASAPCYAISHGDTGIGSIKLGGAGSNSLYWHNAIGDTTCSNSQKQEYTGLAHLHSSQGVANTCFNYASSGVTGAFVLDDRTWPTSCTSR